MKINEVIERQLTKEDIAQIIEEGITWNGVKNAIAGGLIALSAFGITDAEAKAIADMTPEEVKQEVMTSLDDDSARKLLQVIKGEYKDDQEIKQDVQQKQTQKTKADLVKKAEPIDKGNASKINAEIAKDLATSGGPVTFKGVRGTTYEVLAIKTVDDVGKDWKKSKLVALVKWNQSGYPTYHLYGSAGWGVGSKLQGVETSFDDAESAKSTYQKITSKNIGSSVKLKPGSPWNITSLHSWNYFSNIAGPMVGK